MSEIKEIKELKEEDLNKVSGGRGEDEYTYPETVVCKNCNSIAPCVSNNNLARFYKCPNCTYLTCYYKGEWYFCQPDEVTG